MRQLKLSPGAMQAQKSPIETAPRLAYAARFERQSVVSLLSPQFRHPKISQPGQVTMRYFLSFSLLLLLCFNLTFAIQAQGSDAESRAAQWESYALPSGQFVRYVDQTKGWSLWRPAEWSETRQNDGRVDFAAPDQTASVSVATENLPEGYGIAGYATAFLRQLRNQRINPETVKVRRVFPGGVEGREIVLDLERSPGDLIRETIWMTQVGPRVYLFFLFAPPDKHEQYEPLFKRLMLSARIGVAGQWDEQFETLRARLTSEKNPPGLEIEAALIAQAIRTAHPGSASLNQKLAELVTKSPAVIFDLLTDPDPQARAAAIRALSRLGDPVVADVLLLALRDKDAYCSSVAARSIATLINRDDPNFPTAALKNSLPALAENPETILNLGAALSDDKARVMADELLGSNATKTRQAGLQLAVTLPLRGLQLPLAKLLQSKDEQFLALLAEALRLRRDNNSTSELLRLLKAETEYGAARLLGEIAPLEVATQMEQRVKEIDARLEKIAPGASFVITGIAGKPVRNLRGQKNGKQNPPPPPPPMPAKTTPESLEVIRLSEARGALVEAVSKIRFRDRYAKARDDRERHAIYTEARNDSSLSDWADIVLRASAAPATSAEAAIDAAKLSDAPTTGETLFPQETSLYLLAPNLEQTLERLDAALSGVQMETVRDQMTFAFLHKMLKARLASTFSADSTGSVSAALGIDLKAPVGMAQWSGERNTTHSAVLLRVSDRDRLERMLGLYQKQLGGFGSFVTVSSALARFAGAVPAAIPLVMVAAFSPEASLPRGSLKRHIAASVSYRQERLGNLPVTVIEKLATTSQHVIEQERIYLAYLGATAVLAPSRAALSDLLGQAATRAPLAQSDAYHKARSEAGEMVFFSQPGKLYREAVPQDSESLSAFIESISSRLGAESGALRLTPTGAPKTWETIFRLNLQNSEWLKNFRGFGAADLSAPRTLLPHSTVLYAGAVFEPKELLATLKAFDTAAKAEDEKKSPEEKRREAQLDEEEEQRLVPALHGEAAFALLSLKEIFSADEENKIPAMAFALRLKDPKVAEMFRAGKLFTNAKFVENATALGAPVATLDAVSENIFFTVTNDYLVLADSVESLRRLEAKEKFAATRDYIRSTEKLPNNLALFVTYSLDAAFDEARRLAKNDEDTLRAVSVFSALIQAFHSQRAFIAVNRGGAQPVLEGSLAVSFDREGRYNVGRVGPRDNEFDVANALIAPQGLNIPHPTRLESLRLRVTAKQPGIVARVREDISRFAWQRAESSDEQALVWSSTARRIPDKLTIKLPVTAPEFEPYLKSTARINTAAPEIAALAKQIAGDDKDGRSVARKLGEWTHTNLKWKKVESSTVETLASREADCLEHSELYVALARSLGLPARVVTGAAYSGGSFGAHAWVEIYLGQWVEVDPTWGLLDYVDATHVRFADDSFISYAMLNQVALEILETRSTIAEFQKDPARLVREFAAESSEPHRALAFDLALTAEQALGADVFAKLDDKQRAAVINAFDRATAELIEEWAYDWADDPSIVASEIKDARATLLTVFGGGLLRFHLAARDGAWYVTEIENVDEATQLIGDELRDALSTDLSPTRIRRMQYTQNARALEQLEKLIAAKGESPPLLLLKAKTLQAKEFSEKIEKPAPQNEAAKEDAPKQEKKPAPPDAAAELLKQIIARWPDYAPAHYALAEHYALADEQRERAIEPYQRYAKLMPPDPRPWHKVGELYEALERMSEAETAYREAAARDGGNYYRRITLAAFHLRTSQSDKARLALVAALALEKADTVFESFGYEVGLLDEEGLLTGEPDKEQCQRIEELLQSLPKELAKSKTGLRLLVQTQDLQDKRAQAIKTAQRLLTFRPEAADYIIIASLYRANKQFALALSAVTQALKLEDEYASAHYERACILARLGRKKEALASLKRAIELNEGITYGLAGEEDLKPLAALPEFRALLPKEEPAEKQETKPDKPAPPKQ